MPMKNERLLSRALLTQILLARGCAVEPASSLPPSVVPARIPPLSPEARQPPAPLVLSDLLARADKRAGELAKAYDRAREAGEQCVREYDGLASPIAQ